MRETETTPKNQARLYWCNKCGREQIDTLVPQGWYWLNQSSGRSGSARERTVLLGLYCTPACVISKLRSIEGASTVTTPMVGSSTFTHSSTTTS